MSQMKTKNVCHLRWFDRIVLTTQCSCGISYWWCVISRIIIGYLLLRCIIAVAIARACVCVYKWCQWLLPFCDKFHSIIVIHQQTIDSHLYSVWGELRPFVTVCVSIYEFWMKILIVIPVIFFSVACVNSSNGRRISTKYSRFTASA